MGPYDSAWKDIITARFPDFLWFYYPDIAGTVDWSQPPRFLEKELQKLRPAGVTPGRIADLLVRVSLLSGEPALLYCHVEVQGKKVPGFAERLFQYAYRIYDRMHSFPLTLVVLTDNDPAFYPDAFEVTTAGRYLRVEFQIAKIVYFEERLGELEHSSNPFAFVTAAQLEVNALRRGQHRGRRSSSRPRLPAVTGLSHEERCSDPEDDGRQATQKDSEPLHAATGVNTAAMRYELKRRLILKMYRRGFTKDAVRSLLLFLDWILQLPKELEWRLVDDIAKETGGETMPYITSWERMGMEKGIEEGIEKGKKEGEIKGRIEDKREVLMRLMEKKFTLTADEKQLIVSCGDAEKLDAALDEIVFAGKKEEVLVRMA
jgi:hypothetical protein